LSNIETNSNSIRVAIVGSGPAGFYAADHLLKSKEIHAEIDMYDRLPTPHGLVRSGVAPDHQKIKSVTRVYDKIAKDPRFRFIGFVEYGKHIHLEDLEKHYHIVVFATGAQTDRRMNIPGEDLRGSHPATEFVAWYNGHPDYRNLEFDFSCETAAIIGVGNVAIDAARILCLSEEELRATDIADHALEALLNSKIKDIYIIGRRGPAQASFTNPELRELGELEDAVPFALADEVEPDELSLEEITASGDESVERRIEILREYAANTETGKRKRLHLRFLLSPVQITDDGEGKAGSLRLVKNELYRSDDGSIKSRATDEHVEIPAGLVFRSIGYQGMPIPGVPFNHKWGTIHNEKGRVIDPETNAHVPGLYATGWIKRGASGVIGTNKTDSAETVACIIEDVKNEISLTPISTGNGRVEGLIRERQPHFVTYEDWLKIDSLEIARGGECGRPRLKFTSIEEIFTALKGAGYVTEHFGADER
jgi:ferredoxin--NADP+ reductase